ncbi:MAG: hypothetical protein JKX94_07255 [Sneathiella sp.]|nr:hypothetical protein [Sneathiella sp.]
MTLIQERKNLIVRTMDRIRTLLNGRNPDLDVLDAVKSELMELAKSKHLFSLEDFPPPDSNSERNSCLYRLSEDDDHQFALYANVANGTVDAPPHDHTTWAVIVGLLGQERNKFYKKISHGIAVEREEIVEEGTGVTLLPDDLHSIHIQAGEAVLNFHLYGLGLEQLPGRNYWSAHNKIWKVFPPHTDIREARS